MITARPTFRTPSARNEGAHACHERTLLTIGQVARQAGVNVENVRYYQRPDLIEILPCPAGNVRRRPAGTMGRIRFIKRAQQLGFSLHEIGEFLRMGEERCEDVFALAEQKCREVDRQIEDLGRMKQALPSLVDPCRKQGGEVHCQSWNPSPGRIPEKPE